MGGNILPKAKMYIFLSIICLLVNVSVCVVALGSQSINYNNYISSQDYEYGGEMPDSGNNITIGNFVLGTTASFLPFFSIVSLVILGLDETVSIFIGVIIGLIGAIQLFLLIIIALNFLPKILGSGVDV